MINLHAIFAGVLTDAQMALVEQMFKKLDEKASKNHLLDVYYDGHRAFRDLGISVPDSMQNTHAALTWPKKAVTALARKHKFEGFSLAGDLDPFDLNEALERNRFSSELVQAIGSAYKHGVSFLAVSRGIVSVGEPEVIVRAYDAHTMTAIWDGRRRCLSAALSREYAPSGGVSSKKLMSMTVWLEGKMVFAHCEPGSSVWHVDVVEMPTKRVLVEPLVYDPTLTRPFGYSRITPEVRYLTDVALRTLVRTEVSAEFYSSPQRYVNSQKAL